jgi:hypothetical protein
MIAVPGGADRRYGPRRCSEGHALTVRQLVSSLAVALALIAMAPHPAAAFDVTLGATVATPARPVVHGTTNLPDDTVLTVTVSRPGGGFTRTLAVTVKDGGFTAGPFTRDGSDLNPGDYQLQVMMDMSAQPTSVRHVVGSHGMRMDGPLLRQSTTGQVVDYEATFSFMLDAGKPAADRPAASGAPAAGWMVASCTDRVEFLNRSIRAKAVGGHELVGNERDTWIADCVRHTAQIPVQDLSLPPPPAD